MTITLQLKPEVEARMQAQAASRGVSVEEYLEAAIEQLATPPTTGGELLAYWQREGVLGAWADREDISDSASYARDLRRQVETRRRD